jgi:hypothetical protein
LASVLEVGPGPTLNQFFNVFAAAPENQREQGTNFNETQTSSAEDSLALDTIPVSNQLNSTAIIYGKIFILLSFHSV